MAHASLTPKQSARKTLMGYFFISPFILGFLFWFVIPTATAVWMAFQDWNMMTPPKFVAFQNFYNLFEDELFWQALKVTLIYTVFVVPLDHGDGIQHRLTDEHQGARHQLPRKATYHRLRWAGFEPEQFEIVSSFEHFHFTKTHPAYYAEVLGRMGWPDGPVLMVGNDLERDIRPAQMLGLATYHVDDEPASPSGLEAGARGKLADLRPWLESTDLASLIPSFKSVDSVLGILSATPAVINGLSRGFDIVYLVS